MEGHELLWKHQAEQRWGFLLQPKCVWRKVQSLGCGCRFPRQACQRNSADRRVEDIDKASLKKWIVCHWWLGKKNNGDKGESQGIHSLQALKKSKSRYS
jgi:hypothetical protein